MMMPIDPEERVFSLSDLARLFRQKKRSLLHAGLILGLLGMAMAFSRPPHYQAVATFRDRAEKKEADGLIRDVLASMGGSTESPQIVAIMKSNQVLKPLVSRLGLQVHVAQQSWLERKCFRIWNTVRAEWGGQISNVASFRFSDVGYEGEKPLSFDLVFIDSEQFEIRLRQKKYQGRIGQSIDIEKALFSISAFPKSARTGVSYFVTISPWRETVASLRKNFVISAQKQNKTIYELKLNFPDRFLGAYILNEWMEQYRRYLKEDHDRIAQQQLSYLEERQDQVFHTLGKEFDEYVGYLQRNVEGKGFVSVKQETQALLKPYQDLFFQSFRDDVEIDRLSMNHESLAASAAMEKSPVGESIQRIRNHIQELESQRDLISSAIYFRPQKVSLHAGGGDEKQLQLVRNDLIKVKSALDDLEKNEGLPLQLELFHDPDLVVQSWAKRLNEPGEARGDLVLYLQNLVHLFSVREKILQDRQMHFQKPDVELDGIDLETAKKLLVETSSRLDASNAAIQHYRHLHDQIQKPSFEVSSLSAVLKDPVSQQLLSSAAKLHLEMEDENSYSEKESERNRRENTLQRKILQNHLQQLIVVEEINQSIFQDKILSLQKIGLDCINRQICVENEQIAFLSRQRKEALIREKQLLEKKMQEFRSKMNDLPDKWRKENLLKLKTELGIKIMQSVAQLVESKTIGEHLHHVESKPLDLAYPPISPESPHILLFFITGCFLGVFGAFAGLFLKTLYRGFPAGKETLLALRYPLAGVLSPRVEQSAIDDLELRDLEPLRKILLMLDEDPQRRILGIIGGNGPSFSNVLAQLIAKGKKKVLIISSNFENPSIHPGLLQVCNGDLTTSPIQTLRGYDYLSNGGQTRFGAELIRSNAFSELLKKLSTLYDYILVENHSFLDSAESLSILSVSQTAIVTVTKEPIELLTPFAQWAYHEKKCRLMFLVANSSS